MSSKENLAENPMNFNELGENLKCKLCRGEYNTPKVLKCKHTFCLNCMKEHILENAVILEDEKGFPCPTCLEFHLVADTNEPVEMWAQHLDNNDTIEGMLDIIKASDIDERNPEREEDDMSVVNSRLETLEMTRQDGISITVPKCPNHGKCLEFYCKTHARQLCGDCVILQHIHCENVTCGEVVQSHLDETAALGMSAGENKEMARGLAEGIRLRRDNIIQDRERVKSEIKKLKDDIIEKLNDSEEKLNNEINSECDSRIKFYDERLKCCDTIEKTASEAPKFLESLHNTNCPGYVVQSITSRERASESELALLHEIMNSTLECRLNLTTDCGSSSFITSGYNFGFVNFSNVIIDLPSLADSLPGFHRTLSRGPIDSSRILQLNNTIDALLPDEKKKNCITDVCFMKDDRIILIDKNNKRVKLYSKLYEFLDFVKLSGSSPFGVTPAVDDEIAVTIPSASMVQFLTTFENKLSTSRTLDIKQPCYGITYGLRQLFVCCSHFEKMPCCIKIYDTSDKFNRCIVFDAEGSLMFTSLENAFIALNPIESHISVVDQRSDRHTVVTFDLNGNIKSRVPMPNWSDKARGLAYADSFLFVAVENRNLCTVTDVEKQDSEVSEVETTFKLGSPFGVAVNSSRNRVAVTQATSFFNTADNNKVHILI